MHTELANKRREIDSQVANHIRNIRAELEAQQKKLEEEQDVSRQASEMGDRSENAEWQIAQNNIARTLVNIMTLTNIVSTYDKYSASYVPTEKVTIGSTLKVIDKMRNAALYIRIYPPGLGNAKIGAITSASPLGAALLGKTVGTEVIVKAPLGDIPYYIEEVL